MLDGRGDRSEMIKGVRFRVVRRQVPGMTSVSPSGIGLARRRKSIKASRSDRNTCGIYL